MDCGTEAALHLSSGRDQMAAGGSNSHLPPVTTAGTVQMHEKSGGYHDAPEEPGPQEADTNISAARNDVIVSVWA